MSMTFSHANDSRDWTDGAKMGSISRCVTCGGECNSSLENVRDAITRQTFGIRRCTSCGLGITVPRPSDLHPHYESYYGTRHGVTAEFRHERRLSLVANVMGRREGRLLDIGCGDGHFLKIAREAGFHVLGTERNPEPARQQGIEVVRDLNELSQPGIFDCVTLWHSLEHVEDPRTLLARIRVLLRPGGQIIVAVPNAGGIQAKLFGRHWLHLDVPRHLYHFNSKALLCLLEAENFRVMQTWHGELEYDVMGWAQSTLNAIGTQQNAFLQMMMGRKAKASMPYNATIMFAGFILSATSIPLAYFCALAKSGATLVMVAERET